jgi:serine/threonine protein kinase
LDYIFPQNINSQFFSVSTANFTKFYPIDEFQDFNKYFQVYREIEVYYQCQDSDNILHLVELFEDENNFFLVFELVRGGSLANRIEKSERGVMKEDSVRHLVSSIASALVFLHNKGIAHRDIKPDNILLPYENSLEGAKLCDFDLASRAHARQEFRGDLWYVLGLISLKWGVVPHPEAVKPTKFF